jgi:hypothetical protein
MRDEAESEPPCGDGASSKQEDDGASSLGGEENDSVLSEMARRLVVSGPLETSREKANIGVPPEVGRYRVGELIGAGGMGRVYRATDPALGRSIALKILPPELVSDPERLRRFVQEARSASALNHPHIVSIFEIGVVARADGPPLHFIAMELVDGETLRARTRRGPMPLAEAVDVFAQIADALARAHEAGIVHRDLKPENLMVTRDGYAKVLDFGLAKLQSAPVPAAEAAQETTLAQTRAGIMLGTPAYMSPEQVKGEALDARSDVFSLGAVLYEALASRHPFAGDSVVDTLHRIVYAAPAAANLPAEAHPILDRCLAKEKEARSLWRFDATGERGVQLTPGPMDVAPDCSRDGKWVYYLRHTARGPRLSRVPLAGGAPEPLGDASVTHPVVSPDGRQLAALVPPSTALTGPTRIALLTNEGRVTGSIDLPPTVPMAVPVRWTADGRALVYADRIGGADNLFVQPLAGDPRRAWTRFGSGEIDSFAVSPNGEAVAVARHEETSDVVLLRE